MTSYYIFNVMEVKKLLWGRFRSSFHQLILAAISVKSKLQYLALDLLFPLFTFLQEVENWEKNLISADIPLIIYYNIILSESLIWERSSDLFSLYSSFPPTAHRPCRPVQWTADILLFNVLWHLNSQWLLCLCSLSCLKKQEHNLISVSC